MTKLQAEMEGMMLLHHPLLHLLILLLLLQIQDLFQILQEDMVKQLPIYNGEVNAEKLDNWIRQIEVYCRIKKIQDDETKIQLASLRLESVTLIWWESIDSGGHEETW